MLFTIVMSIHGFAVVSTKKLICTNALQINYMLGVLLIIACSVLLPSALADPNYHRPTFSEILEAIVFTGIPVSFGQLLGISAFLMTKKLGMITPFQFSNIVLGYLISIFRYDEDINVICLVGGIMIILGVIFIIRFKDQPPN